MKIRDAKHIHCVGAGGIGVSALVKLFLAQEVLVTGSDMKPGDITRELARRGAIMTYGQTGGVPEKTEIVIYSDAVPYENPERADARIRRIPEMSYAEALGAVSKDKRTIAVSGTNGKSTTTAMLGLMLTAGGFDPTVVVGGQVPAFPLGNLRVGEGEWMVVEADDFHAHMLQIRPEVIVLTNIEEEHLDYFRDLGDIIRAFQSFIDSLPEDGTLIMNADDPVSFEDLTPHANTITYGMEAPADYVGKNLLVQSGEQLVDVLRTSGHEETIGSLTLKVPGRFNVMNALAATSAALQLGVPFETIREVLINFTGIWRRFEHVGRWNGADIISDYGHHPTAIRGTLAAARDFFPGRRIVLVFQPHQRNRTRQLLEQFAGSFYGADLLLLSDIYDVLGREDPADAGVTSESIVGAMQNRQGIPETVLIIMGAGTIDSVARKLTESP